MIKYGDINALNLFVGELNNVSIFILDKNFHYIKLNNSHKKIYGKIIRNSCRSGHEYIRNN